MPTNAGDDYSSPDAGAETDTEAAQIGHGAVCTLGDFHFWKGAGVAKEDTVGREAVLCCPSLVYSTADEDRGWWQRREATTTPRGGD